MESMHFIHKTRFIVVVVVLCLTFVYANCLQAEPGNYSKPWANIPRIEKVFVDYGAMEILIFGQYLRGDADPEISLSSLPIALSANDTGAFGEVIATLPEWYEDGRHLLVLTTESGTSSFDLNIITPNAQCTNKYLQGFASNCGIIQKIDRIANITSGHLEMGNHLSECYMLARQLYSS
jgi:hypothetical protein